jgi:hypothetical protein
MDKPTWGVFTLGEGSKLTATAHDNHARSHVCGWLCEGRRDERSLRRWRREERERGMGLSRGTREVEREVEERPDAVRRV